MVNKVVLGLGGNLGNVIESLELAHQKIEAQIGKVLLKSAYYKTKAWGVEDQPDFINQVIICSSDLPAEEVLRICLEIEKDLGRDRLNGEKWRERLIDIDILFYNNLVVSSEKLTIPHPYLHERNFVLVPLAEVLPNMIHPILQESMNQLKEKSSDKLEVTPV